jgi:hypothetical protein
MTAGVENGNNLDTAPRNQTGLEPKVVRAIVQRQPRSAHANHAGMKLSEERGLQRIP